MARHSAERRPIPRVLERRTDSAEDERIGDEDLTDLLAELRVLLPGAQTLTAFLIILPFNDRFAEISRDERYVYVATFLCALASLILFAAPAAWHRLLRPLRDREGFKTRATRSVIAGLATLSIALVLATQLVLDAVLQRPWLSWGGALIVALMIGVIWWLLPRWLGDEHSGATA
jgi:drug/metabolite transporter (DMT)-like permease